MFMFTFFAALSSSLFPCSAEFLSDLCLPVLRTAVYFKDFFSSSEVEKLHIPTE